MTSAVSVLSRAEDRVEALAPDEVGERVDAERCLQHDGGPKEARDEESTPRIPPHGGHSRREKQPDTDRHDRVPTVL